MPVSRTYPGVYVEEIPSGVHPIVGVSTSDTAFIDFFARGPVNVATRITSLSDFERTFGGLDTRSEASYAIQQFYLNGGQIAWVVRVGDMQPAQLTLQGGSPMQNTLMVQAASPGTWANNLTGHVQVAVDYKRVSDPDKSFNLVAREIAIVNGKPQTINTEIYRNLSMSKLDPSYAVDVVNEASTLVQLQDAGLGARPAATGADVIGAPKDTDFSSLTGGSDGTLLDSAGNVLDATGFSKALQGDPNLKTGMYALERIAPFIFNILCIPAAAKLYVPVVGNYTSVYAAAKEFCDTKRAFLIVDIPPGVDTLVKMTDESGFLGVLDSMRDKNAAVYFPRLVIPDPLAGNRPRNFGPSGTLAGIYTRTDVARGVWKAPAGTDTSLSNAILVVKLTDLEIGALNPLGINVLSNFAIFGNVSWGARTLDGADQQASEWKYIPVRRTALFIEESLFEGLKWAVFEPNDEPLWAQIRLNVGAFMHNLFRQGAFQGQTRREAYFVKCDKDTTTQNDIDRGVVNVVVGFAPLKPAEFVVIQLQQIAGQIQV